MTVKKLWSDDCDTIYHREVDLELSIVETKSAMLKHCLL
jgi:hypothetical protein